jgi:hypothetical protein
MVTGLMMNKSLMTEEEEEEEEDDPMMINGLFIWRMLQN